MADMLSQDEINALLGNGSNANEGTSDNSDEIVSEDMDLLSKISSDTMSASANSLEKNLRQTVTIQEPVVEKLYLSNSKDKFLESSLGVKIEYKVGVEGSNVLVLDPLDAKIIANLMQGGDGTLEDGDKELSMIDESALCEAMNQMVGASSTVLSEIVGEKVDIDTPKLFDVNLDPDEQFFNDFGFAADQECVMSSFVLKIGDLIDSKIIQIMPLSFARKLINGYNSKDEKSSGENNEPKQNNVDMGNTNQMQPNVGGQMMGGSQMQSNNAQFNNTSINQNNMNAKPAQFQSFDYSEVAQQKENINIVMDVPLEVTVEMGRTVRKIEEILEFSPGTIIELDKLAGDPIDILVNGKFVAKGEVVVIDENYGIRITDIINFKNRI